MNAFVIIITNMFIEDNIMPKRIDNLKEKIQEEAKRQVIRSGYSKMTIRSVAQGCRIGIGTMYNYFSSKDELITSFMLEDWRGCVGAMTSLECKDPEEFLRGIQGALDEFIRKYDRLFNDPDAIRSFASVFAQRHIQLRAKLGGIIRPVCENSKIEDKTFLAEYIAESILRWTMEGESFEKQYSIIKMLVEQA